MTEWLALTCLAVGVMFAVVGSIGFFRFEDVYLRLQASSKSLTFGFGFVLVGAGLASGEPALLAKGLLAAVFQFVTAPIAAHMIARSALAAGIRPAKLRPLDAAEERQDASGQPASGRTIKGSEP